jgi:hypothetical protein
VIGIIHIAPPICSSLDSAAANLSDLRTMDRYGAGVRYHARQVRAEPLLRFLMMGSTPCLWERAARRSWAPAVGADRRSGSEKAYTD